MHTATDIEIPGTSAEIQVQEYLVSADVPGILHFQGECPQKFREQAAKVRWKKDIWKSTNRRLLTYDKDKSPFLR